MRNKNLTLATLLIVLSCPVGCAEEEPNTASVDPSVSTVPNEIEEDNRPTEVEQPSGTPESERSPAVSTEQPDDRLALSNSSDEEVSESMDRVEEAQEPPVEGPLVWVGSWATGPQLTEPNNLPPAPGLGGNTLRQNAFLTLSGERIRVLFSNEFGNGPVTFQSVHVAFSLGDSAIEVAGEQALSFEGQPGVTIQAGQSSYSDPLDRSISALTSLSVSIQFGDVPSDVTGHPGSRTTSFIQAGEAVAESDLPEASQTDHWYYITGIDVETREAGGAVVTLGDSITDGRGSTTNENNRWPDNLARRFQAAAQESEDTLPIAVLNQGIGGNAVVRGGLGPTALQRFERDVLEQRDARWVIVLEGVNDIGGSGSAAVANDIIDAYEQFIDSAHAQELLIYGVPILPFGGSSYDSPAHEEARQAVNDWVRTSGRFDAVLDLDVAVADPANPTRLLQRYDDGDGLHLSPAGYQAMADAIDLSLFR